MIWVFGTLEDGFGTRTILVSAFSLFFIKEHLITPSNPFLSVDVNISWMKFIKTGVQSAG